MSGRRSVLVTGPGGYVGSTLAMRLAGAGHRVIGYGHGSNFPALHTRSQEGGVELVSGDLTDRGELGRAMRGVDAVVHAASVTGDVACRRDVGAALRTIVRGTRLVVEAVQAHAIPLLIHVSSYAVYGTLHARPMPLDEEMHLEADDLYGTLKAEAEWEASQVPSIIVRLTNVYGRGAGLILKRDVVGHFVRAVQEGRPLRVFGDGSQGIDFVHVDDVSRVVGVLLEWSRPVRPYVLNVGSGRVVSIRALAELCARAARERLGRDVGIVTEEAPRDKIWPDRWVATQRLRECCPWFPSVTLEHGIDELVTTRW